MARSRANEGERLWKAILAEDSDPVTRDRSLEALAYHESGHAVVAWKLGHKIKKISTVMNDLNQRGYVRMTNNINHTLVLVALAGVAAERRLNGKPSLPFRYQADRDFASQIANEQFNIENGMAKFLKYAKKLVGNMVKHQWPLIDALAKELIKVRVMKGEDATDFLVRCDARLLIETRFPPEPIFDYLDSLPD
jgi:hypothetical protein